MLECLLGYKKYSKFIHSLNNFFIDIDYDILFIPLSREKIVINSVVAKTFWNHLIDFVENNSSNYKLNDK